MLCFVTIKSIRLNPRFLQTCEALHIVLYHYAGNNPVKYTDPDGNSIKNNTGGPLLVRTEHGRYVVLEDGDKYKGRQDGVLCPDGTTYKCFTFANVKVTKDENGNYSFSGGKIANLLVNLIKGAMKLITGKEKDPNQVYDEKYPTGWWTGDKEFVPKEIGDKQNEQEGESSLNRKVDNGSDLKIWWKSIDEEIKMNKTESKEV